MLQTIRRWVQQARCNHAFKYSRSRPGTLVCRKCRARRGRPAG